MTSRSSDLYAEICRFPDRWDLRSVFVDALEEEGDLAWADFIRDSDRGRGFDSPSKELEERLSRPFHQYGRAWVQFRYGLPHTVVISREIFIKCGREILELGPLIEIVVHDDENDWATVIDTVLEAPALRRVRHLTLADSGRCSLAVLLKIIRSSNLDSLLGLTTPLKDDGDPTDTAEIEREMWEALLGSPRFRSMIDWGLGLRPHNLRATFAEDQESQTHRQIGDGVLRDRPNDPYHVITSYRPMSAQDRELEQRFGYIPRLHAVNWKATALDVMRGLVIPAGTPVSEEMYAVPATTVVKDRSDH